MDPVDAKMSKSKPDTSVFLNDPPAEIERKITKAYCPPKETEGNPVLEIARLILFPRADVLTVARDRKFGGDVTYASFRDAANAYARGELHPQDLKAAVVAGLNKELAPVRAYFDAHPENLRAFQAAAARGR